MPLNAYISEECGLCCYPQYIWYLTSVGWLCRDFIVMTLLISANVGSSYLFLAYIEINFSWRVLLVSSTAMCCSYYIWPCVCLKCFSLLSAFVEECVLVSDQLWSGLLGRVGEVLLLLSNAHFTGHSSSLIPVYALFHIHDFTFRNSSR